MLNKLNNRAHVFDGITFAFLAMVFTVIVQAPTDNETYNVIRYFVYFAIYFAVGFVVGLILNKKSIRTWGEQIFLPAQKKAADHEVSFFKTFWGWQATLVMILIFVVGFEKTHFSFSELLDRHGLDGAIRLFRGIFKPDWSILPIAIINIVETIFMAFIATALAIPIAFVLSFLSAKNIMRGPLAYTIYIALRTILNVVRSVEAFIWAIIFSVWVGIGPFAGMLALMVHSVASLAKQYSEMVESVNDGPIEGIQSTGANKLQVIWFAIVPQVILPYISFTVYRWDINVRMATIVGFVGGGGIGTLLIQYQGQALWRQVGCIVVVISIVVWLLDQASAYLREALK